jgi:type I restriction enzyme, S subunit
MSEEQILPKEWKQIPIRDVAEINPKLPNKDKISNKLEVQFLPMKLVEELVNKIHLSETKRFEEVQKGSYTPFINGDVIFAKVTPCMENGKIALVNNLKNGVGFGSSEFHVVRPGSEINGKYIFNYLVQEKFRNEAANEMTGAVGLRRVPKQFIENYLIPLPPLKTQQLIVSKIEELFSELDKGIENLKTAQQQLKTYRQAVLKWAFEGKLLPPSPPSPPSPFIPLPSGEGDDDAPFSPGRRVGDEGKEAELPKGWKWVRIGDVCKSIVPNRDKPKTFSGNIKWVTTPNLTPNSIKLNYDNIFLGLSEAEVKEYNARVIPVGGVIMTCVGTFGLSAIVEKPIVINQQLHGFISNEIVNAKYIAYCIQLNKNFFERKSTSTTIQYVNKENCNSMPLPLCSMAEQNQIIQEIETRLSVADKMEESISQSLQQAEALRQSILKKAFEGRLVQPPSPLIPLPSGEGDDAPFSQGRKVGDEGNAPLSSGRGVGGEGKKQQS